MGAAGSVSLTMSSAQVLADEIPLTSREVAVIDLFRRVYGNGQSHGQFPEDIKRTHDSADADIGVLLWSSSCHSLDADMESFSLDPSGFSFFSFACPQERLYLLSRHRYRLLPLLYCFDLGLACDLVNRHCQVGRFPKARREGYGRKFRFSLSRQQF